MAHILFYEKPGCINNSKQKTWLKSAGHDVEAVNLLEYPWSKEALQPFFEEKSISECFNKTAPLIKSGQLNPDDLSEDAALDKMVGEPILIKRPLIVIDQTFFLQGFDRDRLHSLIGLAPAKGAEDIVRELEQDDLTVCPQLAANTSCDENAEEKTGVPGLTPLLQLVEEMGLEVTYAYDDLVFVEHNAFLFQFLTERTLNLYFNTDCPDKDAISLEQQILSIADKENLVITRKGKFKISQKENEEVLDIEFLNIA